jgi:hypothetical protein
MAATRSKSAADCIARILDAGGGAVTEDELLDFEAEIKRRARTRAREKPTESAEDRLLGVAKEMSEEERIKAFLEKRSAAINVLRRKQVASFIETAPVKKSEALNALNVGGLKGFDGSFLSVQAKALALEMDLWGGMMADLRRAELLGPLESRSPELDREISDALEDADADPATVTKAHSPLAMKIAKVMAKHQENARLLLNDAGAFVRKLPGWIVRQSHDPVKLQAAGFDRWYADILPDLDERTFDGLKVKVSTDAASPDFDAAYRAAEDKARRASLLHTYNSLVTGVHETGSADWLHAFKMPGNKAKSVSQERVLHFKKYRWFDYNAKYGRGTLLEEMAHGLELSARNTALMRTWGTNPEAMFEATRRDLAEQITQDAAMTPKQKAKQVASVQGFWSRNFFDQVNGTANAGGNPTWARRMANVRSWIAMSKLGGVVLSAFPDIGNKASLARHNGVSYFEGLGNGVTSLVRGKGPVEREMMLDHVRGFSEAVAGSIFNRFSADSGLSGGMSRAMRAYFKLNLMTFWDNAQRDGWSDFMARNMGSQTRGEFGALDKRLQTTLRGYGITEREWAVLRKAPRADPTSSAGGRLLTPDMLDDLPDEAFADYAKPAVDATRETDAFKKLSAEDQAKRLEARTAREIKNARRDVKERLSAYYADQIRQSTTRPGARERALVTLGTVAGTPMGEAARFLMQFKAFGIGMLTQHIMREWVRGARPDIAGLAYLIIGTSSLGYLSMTAKELIAGKNPRDITNPDNWPRIIGAAMAQGGGLGIYGDFLFGEYNRFGQSGLATLGGPAIGTAEDIGRLYSDTTDWIKGDRTTAPLAESMRLVKDNVPFANLFWARLALDQMIFNQLQEAMNPGYLRRVERRVKEQNGQTYWLPPSAGRDALAR